jgi:hypothetical protein
MLFAFPAGAAGVALLLLRASVVFFLLTGPAGVGSGNPWSVLLSTFLAILVGAGFSTRIIAGASGLALVVAVWPTGWVHPLPCVSPALDAGALALIGPGAFSIDALIFGRRTMQLPH